MHFEKILKNNEQRKKNFKGIVLQLGVHSTGHVSSAVIGHEMMMVTIHSQKQAFPYLVEHHKEVISFFLLFKVRDSKF